MLAEEYELLSRVWLPVARLADLSNEVTGSNILGNELVIYRIGNDVTVASAVCPHRGMSLHLGQVTDGALECPYHGWQFAARTGECTHIPSLPPGTRGPRASLRVYPSRIQYGLVWSCLGEPYLPFPDVMPEPDESWAVSAGPPYDVRCGMRQLTENFRDRAHFPFVHARTMGDVAKVVDPYSVTRNGWELTWRSSVKPAVTGSPGPGPGEQTLDYRVVLPMYASIRIHGPSGTRVTAQIVTPVTADGTQVRQFWLVGIDAEMVSRGVTADSVASYEQDIFEEDHPIVENQFPREAPLDLHSQTHTPADRFSIMYRRTYRELLAELAGSGSAN